MKSRKLIAPVENPKIGLDDSEILKIMTVAALIFRRKFSLGADNHRVTRYETEERYVLTEPLSDILDHDTYQRIAFKQLDYFPKYGIPMELIYVNEKTFDDYENWFGKGMPTHDKSLEKFGHLLVHQWHTHGTGIIKMADAAPLWLDEALELDLINEKKQAKLLFSAYMDALRMDEYNYSLIFREKQMHPSMLIPENLIALNDPALNLKIQRLIDVSLTLAFLSLQAAKQFEMTKEGAVLDKGNAVYLYHKTECSTAFEICLKNPRRSIYFTTLDEAKFLLIEHIKMIAKEKHKFKRQRSER